MASDYGSDSSDYGSDYDPGSHPESGPFHALIAPAPAPAAGPLYPG